MTASFQHERVASCPALPDSSPQTDPKEHPVHQAILPLGVAADDADRLQIEPYAPLVELSMKVRRNVLGFARHGGCFVGSAFSCVDALVYLYEHVLRFSPLRPHDKDRDILLLSKGHAVPALYGYFIEKGLFPRDRVPLHQSGDDVVYLHPNADVPGIEFPTGSLGHALAVGVGMALHFRAAHTSNRVIVLLGDGELDEGSVWEALQVAAAFRLDNLTVVVDRNGFQANAPTESLIPLEPLVEKFRAFGYEVARGNGHAFESLERLFAAAVPPSGRPRAVILDTVRGRGLPAYENNWEAWFVSITANEEQALVEQLQPVRS